MNTNITTSNKFNSSKSNSNTPSLSLVDTTFERRDVRVGGRGVNLVNILFYCDHNIGSRILKYLSSREIRSLREVCTEMGSMLTQKRFFDLSQYHSFKNVHSAPILLEEAPTSAQQSSISQSVRRLVVTPTSDNELFNELIKAANDPARQQSILSKLPDINIKDKRRFTILHYACIGGDEGLVKILIEKLKAKIDDANLDKQTGLHLAINNGQVNIAKYLITQGADMLVKSSSGQNVLHYAVHYGEKEFITWLFDSHLAEYQKQQLVTSEDNDGKNAMHYAGLHPDSDLVRLLYQKGFKIDATNKYGYTALHFAAGRNENPEVITELVKRGADIDAITINGDNPLGLAIKFNNWKAAEYLGKVELDKYGKNIDPAIKEPLEEGIISYAQGEWVESEKSLSKALSQAESKKDMFSICFILIKLGDVYLSRGNYVTAAKLYSSAFSLSTEDKVTGDLFDRQYFCQKQLSIESRYIREVCENQDIKVTVNFLYYRKMLSDIRANIGEILGEKPIKEVLFEITSSLKAIVCDLLAEVFELLGNPPCEYAILGLGSMSRDEMSPYSDIEFTVVVNDSNKQVKKYFNNALRLLELKMVSLGEEKFPVLGRGARSITKGGFSLDSGGNTPLGKAELIGTPQELAEFQRMNKFNEDIILSNVFKTVCLIKGSKKLFEAYQSSAEKVLSALAPNETIFTGKKLRMKQAMELMKGDIKEFAPELNKAQGEVVFNVKKELYRLPSNFISYLSLYHGLKEKNSFERLEVLRKKKIIAKEGCERLKKLMEFATSLRVKTHLYYGQEEENICHKSIISSKHEGVYEITDGEAKELEEAYRVLIPLHEAIGEFVESSGTGSFEKKNLYANSLYIDATVQEKLGNPDKALECYAKALQLDPDSLSILFKLIQLKIKLNDFKEIEELSLQALEIAAKKHGKERDEYAKGLYLLANVYKTQEKHEKALECYLGILEFRNNPRNKASIISNSFNELVKVYIDLREYGKAKKHAEESLEFSTSSSGEKGGQVVNSLNALVAVYLAQENYEEAEIHCKKALNLAQAIHGKGSKETLKILDNYGDISFGHGEVSKAFHYYNQALFLRKSLYGKNSIEVAKSYDKLSSLYYMYGQYKEAVNEGHASLEIKINSCGNPMELAESRHRLSRSYYALNDYEQALKHEQGATKIIEELYGKTHPKTLESYCNLGNIYYALNDKPQALAYYSKASSAADISHEMLVSLLKNNCRKFSQLKRFITEEECSLINSYINLAIVQQPEEKAKEKSPEGIDAEKEPISEPEAKGGHNPKKEDFRDERLANYESLYEINESIALKELFDAVEGSAIEKNKAASKVIVYGRAGIGKTTMCKYIVSRWQHGSLWQNKFEAIFWLPLRELIAYSEENFPSLFKIIQDKCIANEHIGEETIKAFIQKNNSKVLFILDGYDEVAQIIDKRKGLENLLLEVLNNENWHVLLTSRPMQISRIGEQTIKFDQHLENIGFTNENVEVYVRRFASQESERLIKFLKNNSSIWGIAHVPINLELICSIWESSVNGNERAEYTMTDLYDKIVEKLLERYLKKFHRANLKALSSEVLRNKAEVVNKLLEKIALKGMASNQIIIAKEAINEILEEASGEREALFNELLATGIIRIMDSASGLKDIHFIHLTFQEYYAARFIVNALEKGNGDDYETAIRLIEEHKYVPYCEVMWWYVAGLVYNRYLENKMSVGLENFWKAIDARPRDLLSNVHMNLIIKCLDESKADDRVTVLKEQLLQVKEWLSVKYDKGQLQKRLEMSPYIRRNKIAVSSFIEKLCNGGWRFRNSAVDALVDIGHANPAVISGLLEVLRDEGSDVRCSAARALGSIGHANPEVISDLLAVLRDRDSKVRRSAVEALGSIGHASPEVISSLLAVLHDRDSDVRRSAVEALRSIGHASPEVISSLLAALRDEDNDVRQSAAEALGSLGHASPEVISNLLTAFGDKDSGVRRSAVEALGSIGHASPEVINSLFAALRDEDNGVRRSAGGALVNIGYTSPNVISGLLVALRNKDSDAIGFAARVLGSIGHASSQMTNSIATIHDKNCNIRISAAETLGKIGHASPRVINGLLTAVRDKDYDVRKSAAEAMKGIGYVGPEVIDGLFAAIRDKNYNIRYSPNVTIDFGECDIRYFLARALKSIVHNSPEVISNLLAALRDEDSDVRQSSAEALGKIAYASPEVISNLLVALRDENSGVKKSATEALGSLGQASPEVISNLLVALRDENSGVKKSAAEALGSLDQANLEVISNLLAVLRDEDSDVRQSAAEALESLGHVSPEVTSGLLAALRDENSGVKKSAAKALGSLGYASPEVISGLLVALHDKKNHVRHYTASALWKLGNASPEVIKGLLATLHNGDFRMKEFVAQVLKIGSDRPEVIEGLLVVLKDWDKAIRESSAQVLGKIGSASFDLFSITVANEVRDDNAIELLAEKLPINILIKCFAVSSNSKWIEKLLYSKDSCCLILNDNTLSISTQQKTEKISLTQEQTNSLLNSLKNYANKTGLSQLTNVYDHYLNLMNNPPIISQSNN